MEMISSDAIIFTFPRIERETPVWLGRFSELQVIYTLSAGEIMTIELKADKPQNALLLIGFDGDTDNPTAVYTTFIDPYLQSHEGYLTSAFIRTLNRNLERVMPLIEYEADRHAYFTFENTSSSDVTIEVIFSVIINRADWLREFDKIRRFEYGMENNKIRNTSSPE